LKLLIDIGNSRIKWACLCEGNLENPQVLAYEDLDRDELFGQIIQIKDKPDQVWIANVAGKDFGDGITSVIRNKWNLTPIFARVEPECSGVTNAYRDISQLGIDRWLSVVAAWTRYKAPACVVSCGTAVTIDGVSGSGRHLGGLIVPGQRMMQDALIRETSGIKAEPGIDFTIKFGASTAECINYGSVRALVSLVDNVAVEMIQTFGQSLCRIITGGYAGQVNALLTNKFEHDPHLVLHGLAIVAEETP